MGIIVETDLGHDPTAAVCHEHPEVATWIKGRPIKSEGGWSTVSHNNDSIIADIDYEKLWNYICNFE